MALATDYKITSAEVNGVHVEAQPNVLRGTATQNKQVFDKYSDLIVERFNGLCDYIDTDTSAVVDNAVLAYFASIGWVAN